MNYFCLTDIGLKRQVNQDSYCSIKNENGDSLFLVCDGIGGGKAGDVASSEAVKYFINDFSKTNKFLNVDEAKNYIKDNINKCNNEIYKLSLKYKEYAGMGTTITGILMSEFGVVCFNVGDSRVYGYKADEEHQLTFDDTLVNEMLKNGEISKEEALNHPKRHYLIKALGIWQYVDPDIKVVSNYDYYLICSDGLYNYIANEDLKNIMIDNKLNSEDKAKKLLEKSLLNGGYDNITIIVVDSLNE